MLWENQWTSIKHLFIFSLEKEIFSKTIKIAKVTSLFQNDEPEDTTIYCPISVPPWFSKVLKRIVYNRLYK